MSDQAPTETATPATPNDRATTFQPVEGGNEVHSGTTLMVEAYAAIWLILMAWLVLVWRKQAALHQRIDGLEHAIDRAAEKQASAAKGPFAKGDE
jgi:hypothetical protein